MPLESHQLDSFIKGWFVGDFTPTLIPTRDVEIGIKHYRAGDHEPAHHHRIATELTAVVIGRVRMSGQEFGPGEIIRIPPGQATDFTSLTDSTTVVVKFPGAPDDKYPGEAPAAGH